MCTVCQHAATSEWPVFLATAQRKKATAQREAYKLTLKTLESLDGASQVEVRLWPCLF